ncbi:HNH endonuclease [Streptomyces sp. NPDC002746]
MSEIPVPGIHGHATSAGASSRASPWPARRTVPLDDLVAIRLWGNTTPWARLARKLSFRTEGWDEAMASTSCRVNPDVNSRRRLWGDSGGYCGNPKCRKYLFPDDLDVDFGELAHVIPASPDGPRGVPLSEVSAKDRGHHSNLILLCANCHTTIDKAPSPYPPEMLYSWKLERVEEIQIAVSTPVFQNRAEVRAHIQGLLDDNALIHTRYGPVGDPYRQGDPVLWIRHARSTIVPNNRRVLRALDANRHLMTPEEQQILAIYRLHVEQFESRHVLDDFTTGTERFPVGIQNIFLNEDMTSRT